MVKKTLYRLDLQRTEGRHRVARIATAINRMLKGLKWDEKKKGNEKT